MRDFLNLFCFSVCLPLFVGFNASAQVNLRNTQTAYKIEFGQPSQRNAVNPVSALFYEDFEGIAIPNLPSNWLTVGQDTTKKYYTGVAGNFVGQANEGGFWQVPVHSVFAMTNDDACGICDKSADSLFTPVLNFAADSNLRLQFEYYFDAALTSTASVVVSINNGGFQNIGNLPKGDNWQTFNLAIPQISFQSNVQFAFVYNDMGQSATGLAIDNIGIYQQFKTDIAIDSVSWNGTSDFYSKIPLRQIAGKSIEITTTIANQGQTDISVAGISHQLTGALTTRLNSSSKSIGSNTVKITSNSSPIKSIGQYQLVSSVVAKNDKCSENNVFNQSIDVTENTVAWDRDQTGIGRYYGRNNKYEILQAFEFSNADTINALWFYFHPATDDTAAVQIFLKNSSFVNISTINNYQLDATKQGRWLRIPITPITTNPAKLYVGFTVLEGNVFINSDNDKHQPNGDNVLKFQGFGARTPAEFIPWIRLETTPQPKPCNLDYQVNLANPSCGIDSSGMVEITTSDSLDYQWSNGDSTSRLSMITDGNYFVTITTGTGCTITDSFAIQSNTSLFLGVIESTSDSCEQSSGSVKIEIIDLNANAFANATWPDGSTSFFKTGLSIGTHKLLLSNNTGCTFYDSITIDGTKAPEIQAVIGNASCGASNGQIVLNSDSGSNYAYVWSTGAVTDSIGGLSAGIYTVTVSDSIGCQSIEFLALNDSNAIRLFIDSVSSPSCNGLADAGIFVDTIGNGSNGPYTFLWDDIAGSISLNLNNVEAGRYTLMVQSGNGCTSYLNDSIEQPKALNLNGTVKDVSCLDSLTGAIQLNTNGGTAPYNYNWSNGKTTAYLANTGAGIYQITVSDSNGCTSVDTFKIDRPNSVLSLTISTYTDSTQTPWGAISAKVAGGATPYQYNWSNTAKTDSISYLEGGIYTLTVTDNFGCQIIETISIEPVGIFPITRSQNEEVIIYPNPTNGLINFTPNVEIGSKIELLSLDGKLVKSFLLTEPTYRLSHNFSGSYILKINSQRHRSFHRLQVY